MDRTFGVRRRAERAPVGALVRSGLGVLALSVIAPPAPCAGADLLDRIPGHGAPAPAGSLETAPDVSFEPRPRIHGALPGRSIRNLRLGYVLALKTVRSNPTCGRLFASLGASGVDSLASTHYAPADRDAARVCAGGVAAFTTVGGRVTWLCPEFANLHPRAAALTLVHEALHSAGMPESPATAGALTAQQINDLVECACTPGPARRDAGAMVARNP